MCTVIAAVAFIALSPDAATLTTRYGQNENENEKIIIYECLFEFMSETTRQYSWRNMAPEQFTLLELHESCLVGRPPHAERIEYYEHSNSAAQYSCWRFKY